MSFSEKERGEEKKDVWVRSAVLHFIVSDQLYENNDKTSNKAFIQANNGTVLEHETANSSPHLTSSPFYIPMKLPSGWKLLFDAADNFKSCLEFLKISSFIYHN